MATKQWKLAKSVSYPKPQQTLDPFAVKSLPQEYQLNSWKHAILNNGGMIWRYIETSLGRLDKNCIDIILKLHTAKGIQAAVQQEIDWYSMTYSKLPTVSQNPEASLIASFQNMLYSNRYDEIREPRPGCHWTLCHVDIAAKKIVYGDSLAWPAPNDLLGKVDSYLKAVCKDDDVSNYSVAILHDPTSKCPKSGAHRCGDTCASFYPLQTCSSICELL